MDMKSKIKTFVSMLVVAALIAAMTSVIVTGQYSGSEGSITGVWKTVVTPKICGGPSLPISFPGILLFNKDGNTTGASTLVSSGYGVWKREPGDHNYSFKLLSFHLDPNGALLGTRVIWQNVTLTTGDTMTTEGGFTDYDPAGNQTASGCSTATGARFE